MIEVCFDMAGIPGANPANPLDPRALRFRDAAARLIDTALLSAGLGTQVGTDAGAGDVTVRLAVTDFDAAEGALREALADTAYAQIREILRYWETEAAA